MDHQNIGKGVLGVGQEAVSQQGQQLNLLESVLRLLGHQQAPVLPGSDDPLHVLFSRENLQQNLPPLLKQLIGGDSLVQSKNQVLSVLSNESSGTPCCVLPNESDRQKTVQKTDVSNEVKNILNQRINIAESIQSDLASQQINDALAQYEQTQEQSRDSSVNTMDEILNELSFLRDKVILQEQQLVQFQNMRRTPVVGEFRVFGDKLFRFEADQAFHLIEGGQNKLEQQINPTQINQTVAEPIQVESDMFTPGTLLSGTRVKVPVAEATQHDTMTVQHNGTTVQPTLVPREIKVEKPQTFDGKHNQLNNFIFTMKQYIDTVSLGEGPMACRFLVSYLKGDALTWWRSYANDNLEVFDELTLDVLIEALREQFSDVDREMKLRDKLLQLKQITNVQSYVNTFRKLQLELGTFKLQEDVAMHCFIQGLKPFTRQQVHLQRPDNLHEAIILAERCDQSLSWTRSVQQRPNNFGNRPNQINYRNASQYSNVRTPGPVPMVLGTVQKDNKQYGNRPVNNNPNIICHHCGKKGHLRRDCFSLRKLEQNQRVQNNYGRNPVNQPNKIETPKN